MLGLFEERGGVGAHVRSALDVDAETILLGVDAITPRAPDSSEPPAGSTRQPWWRSLIVWRRSPRPNRLPITDRYCRDRGTAPTAYCPLPPQQVQRREAAAEHALARTRQPLLKQRGIQPAEIGVKFQIALAVEVGQAGMGADDACVHAAAG
jgi:hypothetical protein